jgi:hypothetical protein
MSCTIPELIYDEPLMVMTISAASSSAQRPAIRQDFTGKERDAETGLTIRDVPLVSNCYLPLFPR